MSFIKVPYRPLNVYKIKGNHISHNTLHNVYIHTIPKTAKFRRSCYELLTAGYKIYYTHGIVPITVERTNAPAIKTKHWTILPDIGIEHTIPKYEQRCHIIPWAKIERREFMKLKNSRYEEGTNTLKVFVNDDYLESDPYIISRPEWILDFEQDMENLYLFEYAITYMIRNGIHIYLISGASWMHRINNLLEKIMREMPKRSHEEFCKKFYNADIRKKMKQLQGMPFT